MAGLSVQVPRLVKISMAMMMGTIAGVKAASYGSGKRVVLKSVTVTARSSAA